MPLAWTLDGPALNGDGPCAVCGRTGCLIIVLACPCKKNCLAQQYQAVPLDARGLYVRDDRAVAAGKCWNCFREPLPEAVEWCED